MNKLELHQQIVSMIVLTGKTFFNISVILPSESEMMEFKTELNQYLSEVPFYLRPRRLNETDTVIEFVNSTINFHSDPHSSQNLNVSLVFMAESVSTDHKALYDFKIALGLQPHVVMFNLY